MSDIKTEIEEEIDLLHYINVVLRYLWIIAPVTALGAIATFFICQALPPKYRAESRVEIFENKAVQISDTIDEEFRSRKFNPLSRHIVLLEGDALNKPVEDKIFKKYPELENYKISPIGIEVIPVKGAETSLLDIRVDSFNEDAALEYLKQVFTDYENTRLKENEKKVNETLAVLNAENKRLKEEIQAAQDANIKFKTDNNFIFLATKSEFDKKYIGELFEKANHKQFEYDLLHEQLKNLKKYPERRDFIFSQIADTITSSNQTGYFKLQPALVRDIGDWKKIKVKQLRIKAKYQIKLKKYKPDHPKMREIKDELEIITVEEDDYVQNIQN